MAEAVAQERPCTVEDQAAWSQYLQGGCTDFSRALNLLNAGYTLLPHRPFEGETAEQLHDKMRYDAELKFFDIRNQKVRELMRRVTEHQYREQSEQKDPIDLSGRSAGEHIAACRLLLETWIKLGGSDANNISRGIPVAKEVKSRFYGPPETYVAQWEEGNSRYSVLSEHRTDSSTNGQGQVDPFYLPRLGDSYVQGVSAYEGILRDLTGMMAVLGGAYPGPGQRRLADLFIQFAHSHSLAGAPELSNQQRDKLFKICSLIMEKEQAQWQASCFIGEGYWQLGMAVSFARLIILFGDGKISLQDVFNKYGIYCNHPSIMLNSQFSVKRRCNDIDKRYEEYKDRPLTEEDAKLDLETVYGQCAL